MKNSNFFIVLFIINFFSLFDIQTNLFSMNRCPLKEKTYSTPIEREKNDTPGNLQELIIASGYFKLELYIKRLISLDKKLTELTNTMPTKKSKQKVWTNKNIKPITVITPKINNIRKINSAKSKRI